PAHTRTPQQTKQQGFGLIVTMLGAKQHFALPQPLTECRVTRAPRGLLQTRAWHHLDPDDFQRNVQLLADALAMPWPGIGRRLQAVVNMHGTERRQLFLSRPVGEQMQQHAGIQATGECDTPGRNRTPWLQSLAQAKFESSHCSSLNNNGPE